MTTAKRGALLDVVSRWAFWIPNHGVLKDWGCFKANSIFRVEQDVFPPELPDWTGGVYPCTDGETVWIPHGPTGVCISIFLHETAHALLHYPNGPDPSFADPNPGLTSVLEAEACAAAYLAAMSLDQEPLYNKRYLEAWEGDAETFKRDSKGRVCEAAKRIANQQSGIAEMMRRRSTKGVDTGVHFQNPGRSQREAICDPIVEMARCVVRMANGPVERDGLTPMKSGGGLRND